MSGLKLMVHALDGGVALALVGREGGVEIAMGWRAAHGIINDVGYASELTTRHERKDDAGRWVLWRDGRLEVAEHVVEEVERRRDDPKDQVFVRQLGTGLDALGELSRAQAVFASDAEPHLRPPSARGLHLDDGAWFVAEPGTDAFDGGDDEGIGAAPNVGVGDSPLAVIGEADCQEGAEDRASLGDDDARMPPTAAATECDVVDQDGDVARMLPGEVSHGATDRSRESRDPSLENPEIDQ